MQRLPIFRDLSLKTYNRNTGRKCQIGLKGSTGMTVTCRWASQIWSVALMTFLTLLSSMSLHQSPQRNKTASSAPFFNPPVALFLPPLYFYFLKSDHNWVTFSHLGDMTFLYLFLNRHFFFKHLRVVTRRTLFSSLREKNNCMNDNWCWEDFISLYSTTEIAEHSWHDSQCVCIITLPT